jgi:hypothetical protein
MTGDQLPLFDFPASPMRRTAPAPKSSPVRYTRIVPTAKRRLCDDCCQEIHRIGQAFAPYPKRAIWRRTDDTTTVLLCQPHKDERHADETP